MQHSCVMNIISAYLFCNSMFAPEKVWNSGYIHVAIVGWTQVKYSCTIGWAVFMYCYISLEVFMMYWNIQQTTQNLGKSWEVAVVG